MIFKQIEYVILTIQLNLSSVYSNMNFLNELTVSTEQINKFKNSSKINKEKFKMYGVKAVKIDLFIKEMKKSQNEVKISKKNIEEINIFLGKYKLRDPKPDTNKVLELEEIELDVDEIEEMKRKEKERKEKERIKMDKMKEELMGKRYTMTKNFTSDIDRIQMLYTFKFADDYFKNEKDKWEYIDNFIYERYHNKECRSSDKEMLELVMEIH